DSASRLLKEEVDEEDIAAIVSKWTGVPVSKMLEGEIQKLTQMETRLRERVVGQDEALTAVANAIRRSRAGLSDPKRPIGSFIFLGPTGVGKTETARALAEFLFDDESAMVRIDMSEYMEKHAVARLIGAPPGYIGFDEGGQLTEAVRRRPYAVILFDEIEKAHPDVFNVLLQVLDDGRLTDSKGRTVSFKNTVVIMTSNVGAAQLMTAWAEGEEGFSEAKERVMGELRKQFRPEFLNRVDDIVVFHPLGESQLTHIVDLRLNDLRQMLEARKITLELTEAAREFIFHAGYDRAYGARPLKRAIQRTVQDPLAMRILDGRVLHGDRVLVDVDGIGGLSFKTPDRTPDPVPQLA
ncbi:MAG: AAA family ATPase, partial [Janthinobacterium lividum]